MAKLTQYQGTVACLSASATQVSSTELLVSELVIERPGASNSIKVRMGTKDLGAHASFLGIQIVNSTTAGVIEQYTYSAPTAAERGTHGSGSGQQKIDLADVYVTSSANVTLSYLAIA